jgi:hypothetical protein
MQCAISGYTWSGGNQMCTLYFAVECEGACVYTIKLMMQGRDRVNGTAATRNIPYYLTSDAYFTGSVAFNQTQYFYYPVTQSTGDVVVFLNKTGPAGNGDTRVFLNVIPNAAAFTPTA